MSALRQKYTGIPILEVPVEQQLDQVATTLYKDSLQVTSQPAADWNITDNLFEKSKNAYDEVLDVFTDKPRVYRLEEVRRRQLPEQKSLPPSATDQMNDDLEAYLDPYALPPPWIADYDRFGRLIYVNTVTKKRVPAEQPPLIWEEKLSLLAKLTPRIDSDGGFAYRETDEERRRRKRVVTQREAKVESERQRRLQSPNELEQVEDTLLFLIDRVVHLDKKRIRQEQLALSLRPPTLSHPSQRGYPMVPLPSLDLREQSRLEVSDDPNTDPSATVILANHTVLPATSSPQDWCQLRLRLLLDPAAMLPKTPDDKPRPPLEQQLLAALPALLALPASCLTIDQITRLHSSPTDMIPTTPPGPATPLPSLPTEPLQQSLTRHLKEIKKQTARAIDVVFDADLALYLGDPPDSPPPLRIPLPAPEIGRAGDIELRNKRIDLLKRQWTTANAPPKRIFPEIDLSASLTKLRSKQPKEVTLPQRLPYDIALTVYLSPVMKTEGLEDLNAEDVAYFLADQLKQGPIKLSLINADALLCSTTHTVTSTKLAFSNWSSLYTHFVHPSFFGYSTLKPVLKQHPVNPDKALLTTKTIDPTVVMSSEALAALKAMGTTLLLQGKVDHHKVKASEITAEDVDRLRFNWTEAERVLATFLAKKNPRFPGLSKEETRLLAACDRAKTAYSSARKVLEQRAHHKPPVALVFTAEESMEGEVSIEGDQEELAEILAKKRATSAATRNIRARERALRARLGSQRAWILQNLVAQSEDPKHFEVEISEQIQRREMIKSNADKALGMSREVLEEIREAAAVAKRLELSEQKNTRILFRIALESLEATEEVQASEYQGIAVISIEQLMVYIETSVNDMRAAVTAQEERLKLAALKKKARAKDRRQAQFADVKAKSMARLLPSQSQSAGLLDATESVITMTSRGSFLDEQSLIEQEPMQFEILRQLRWPMVVCFTPSFRYCLHNLPTLIASNISEDELAQFAVIVSELEEIYNAASKKCATAVDKKTTSENRSPSKKKVEVVVAKDAATVAKKKADEEIRLQAHQHVYIMLGDSLECIVCVERRHERWRHEAVQLEQKWVAGFRDLLVDAVNAFKSKLDSSDEQSLAEYHKEIPSNKNSLTTKEWTMTGAGHFKTLISRRFILEADSSTTTETGGLQQASLADAEGVKDASVDSYRSGAILFKVWSWNRYVNNICLGEVSINSEYILNAAVGIRYYTLVHPETKVSVNVQLAVKVLRLDNQMLRIDIVGARGLGSLIDAKTCNPFVEVLWQGNVTAGKSIGGIATELSEWESIGCTIPRGCTVAPQWDSHEGAVFLLPPVWNAGDIYRLDSSTEEGVVIVQGGWVPGNYDSSVLTSPHFKSVISLIAARQLKPAPSHVDEDEMTRLVNAYRDLFIEEEEERRMMFEEELLTRNYAINALVDSNSHVVQEQRLLSKEFTQLQSSIQLPSALVSRLRFMLAETLDGGTMKFFCQDPATTGRTMKLYAIPVQYPEDEKELRRQAASLMVRRSPGVLPISDFSIHTVRSFNSKGFAFVNQRLAVLVAELVDGVTLEDYMYRKWDVLPDAEFKRLLLQVVTTLGELHSQRILHRNLHAGAVTVKTIRSNDICVVDDFWFLHNPRVIGCVYSQSRADWGNIDIMPPELRQTGVVDEKSDVFAFGVCAYQWAAARLRSKVSHVSGIEALLRSLPPRWGPWLEKLLRVCLQPLPDQRADIKMIRALLSTNR